MNDKTRVRTGGRSLALLAIAAGIGYAAPAQAANVSEGFAAWPPAGWTITNNSSPAGSTSWFQGNTGVLTAQAGATNSYAAANFNATTGANTISDWLITPALTTISNGDTWSFWTRVPTSSPFPDRLEFRLSTDGACSPGTTNASVGDFGTLLATVNPALTVGGYPETWTRFQGTFSGLGSAPATGCFAFRYFVTNGGPTGGNSNYIGVDTFAFAESGDVTPPQTTITGGIVDGAATNEASPTFTFSANEPGTFQCRFDAAAFAACTSPHTPSAPLADGPHVFEVRAIDTSSNVDPTPDARSFTLDATPPETTIDTGPAPGSATSNATPTFGFSASEGATFECRIDGADFGPCSGPGDVHTGGPLADGAHNFDVRATDAVGNRDASPASRQFLVDSRVPNVAITKSPDRRTTHKTAAFEFSADEPVTFRCQLDDQPAAPCSSPHSEKVKPGKHTLTFTATDTAGNQGRASVSWKVRRKHHANHH
jgi:hypothetical protein